MSVRAAAHAKGRPIRRPAASLRQGGRISPSGHKGAARVLYDYHRALMIDEADELYAVWVGTVALQIPNSGDNLLTMHGTGQL